MTRLHPSLTLALAIATSLAALSGCRGWNSEEPPVHLMWNMDTQEKGKAYRAIEALHNPKDPGVAVFADGRMMRMPVDGTVPRGHLRDDDLSELGVDDKGEPTVKFPPTYTATDASRARGKIRFAVYCAPCHGKDGAGTGPVNQSKGLLVPPPSFHDARFKEMPNGKIYQAITHGVNNGNMPAYNVQISVEDRWAIVAYMRELQRTRDANVSDEPAPGVVVATVGAERGAGLYKSKGCNACHSLDGSKVVGPSFKGLWGATEQTDKGPVVVDEAYLKESILNPTAKIVTGFPPAMPPQVLNDDDIKSIALYLETLK